MLKSLQKILFLAALLSISFTACSQSTTPSVEQLAEKLSALSIGVTNIKEEARNNQSPIPNSWEKHFSFTIQSVAPSGGQMFICNKVEYCDSIYNYFDALRVFAGPYIYKSSNGLVVAQLNSGLSTQEAEQIESVLAELK